MANAVNFITFCKDSSIQAIIVTWDELDQIQREPDQSDSKTLLIPNLPNNDFCKILQGKRDPELAKTHFPIEFSEFINECYTPIYLKCFSDENINIFLTKAAKPQASQEDIIQNLLE
jgi:hypothetical protein